MFTNGYRGRKYSSRQSMQGSFSTRTGSSSSLLPNSRRTSSSHQQTPQATSSRYASGNTYLRDSSEYSEYDDGELTQLVCPPPPPPSLDQILSTQPSNSRPWQPETTQTLSHRNIYQEFAAEFCAEPSSSSSAQPEADDYRRIYNEYAQIIATTPHSNSGQQSMASRSTPIVSSQASARYPGVRYLERNGDRKWAAGVNYKGKYHSVGSFRTPEEAQQRLAEYRISLGLPPTPRTYTRYPRNPG